MKELSTYSKQILESAQQHMSKFTKNIKSMVDIKAIDTISDSSDGIKVHEVDIPITAIKKAKDIDKIVSLASKYSTYKSSSVDGDNGLVKLFFVEK